MALSQVTIYVSLKLRGLLGAPGWISKARSYTEKNLGCTVWNIAGRGWRRATDRETAIYYMKCVKKTISWADRTINLQTISKREHIPGAIKHVFCDAEGNIKKLSGARKKYFEIFTQLYLTKKETINEKALIGKN